MTCKSLLVFSLGMALFSCSSDGGGGDDTLPKRGEMASDPTIVSAIASCSTCGGEICVPNETEAATYLVIRVASSDPAGVENLGTCSGTVNGITDQDEYGGGSAGSDCYLYFKSACAAGDVFTADLTVSNLMAGVTTASVKVTAAD
jgi:hypothetical protein